MSTFALVHGSMHGGWCWDLVVPELEALGHRAVAPDLPCDDPSADLDDYAATVIEALGDTEEQVVVVGHSLGSRTVPVVASRRPVHRMVFLCSLPVFARIEPEVLAGEMVTAAFRAAEYDVDEHGSERMRPTSAVDVFFHDCPPTLAAWAASKLRHQAKGPIHQDMPIGAWPDVPTSIVLTDDDQAINPSWAAAEAARWSGSEPVHLPGSHSPFLSRPAELARVLDELARVTG